MIDEQMPEVGDIIKIFGKEWEVEFVEPYSDWVMSIELVDVSNFDMTMKIKMPTERLTDEYPEGR